MMCDENEVDQLLGPFQAALDALNRIENVEALMLKLEPQNRKKLLKKVKSIASEVYGRASLIKETVSKAYKRSKVGEGNKEPVSNPSEDVEVNGTDEARYSPVLKRSKSLRNAEKTTAQPLKADSSEAAAAPIRAAEPAAEPNPTTDITLDTDCSDVIQSSPTASQEISNGIPETDPLEAPAGETPKAPLLSEDNSENSPEAQVETNPQQADTNSIPKIKVVDINKLLAPKQETEDSPTIKGRKSVTFDSSVVVLTSSDEDTPKKNPKETDLSPLKSVLRKTASSLVIDLSDSDSKENNENLRNTRKTKVKQPVADKSSEESDSDHYSGSKRLRRQVKHMKSKFTDLIERRRTRRTQDNLSDDEETNKGRKTPLKEKSTKKHKRREKSDSDGSSDDINQPDSTTALPDPKINWNLYVSLPKFACEELPELYRKSKEVFQAAENSRQETGNRTLKLTLKLNKNRMAKDEASDSTTTVNQESESCTGGKSDRESCIEASADAYQAKTTGDNDHPDVDSTSPPKKTLIVQSDSEDDTVPQTPNMTPSQEAAEESHATADTSKVASDSDSDEDFAKLSKKFDSKFNKKVTKKQKKVLFSDSESGSDHAANKSANSDSEHEHEAEEESESEDKSKQPKARIKKRGRDSSSDDDDKSTRKQIRKMIDRDELSETTRAAGEKEKQRKARIAEKQRKYNQFHETKTDATVDKLIMDFDEDSKKPLLSVHESLVEQLKPHQVQGIKFMWDACFESLERAGKGKGSGCILAHCMGLGKTLQVITLVHTLLTHQDKTKVKKVMVVSPVNTVLNWISEFKRWIPDNDDFEVYELVTCRTSAINQERSYTVKYWHENGGVLIIGYNMFRNLSNPDNKSISKKLRSVFQTGLVDPGPDLVVCDEGHLLKNEKTNLSIAMNRIKTSRRIVLTGTPLQNNLREYWCMVQFIKPNLLGTYKEYMNRFVNPITNGQYTDSTQHDIMVMRRRSHVLHKLLDGVVQRQDYAVLEPYLPPKNEYVLFLKLSELQTKLYKHYMAHFARRSDGSNRTSFLFTDFQELQRICTHPRVLLDKSNEERDKKCIVDDESDSEGSLKDFIDDSDGKTSSDGTTDSDDSCSDASIRSSASVQKKKRRKGKSAPTRATRLTRAQAAQKTSDDELELIQEESGPKQWWEEYVNKTELDNIKYGSKIFMLLQILKECEEIGDKVLVFSQSLYALNSIQYFLERIDEATQKGETETVGGYTGSWSIGLDYFRLDGSSSCDNRASWCDHFNNPQNTRARLFLISTKAGGLGINLVAANRVIIFDVSWNPSHDIQSIYRVYRFGQTKPTYIYRFVTYGAMEMKIYERQVTKQAISKRVIDEQQIDRHYSQNDIQELYKTDLEPDERPIPLVPKDVLLGEMLQVHDKVIYKYHEHQSLLENKQDEQLNEEERKAAWDEFENEKVIRKTTVTNFAGLNLVNQANALNFSPQMIQMALANMVRKDNPNWTQMQIKNILPGLVAQLQIQMSENNFSLHTKVVQELRMMQMMQAQRMHENMLKQYQMQQLLQNQQVANQLLGNLHITPEELRHIQMAQAASQNFPQPGRSNEIIDLNN